MLCNTQYNELCDFPDDLLKVGGPMSDELGFQAERGDFGPGDKDELVEQVLEVYQRREALSFERVIAGTGRTVQISVAPTPGSWSRASTAPSPRGETSRFWHVRGAPPGSSSRADR